MFLLIKGFKAKAYYYLTVIVTNTSSLRGVTRCLLIDSIALLQILSYSRIVSLALSLGT